MINECRIGKPYIEKSGDTVRLCSDICLSGKKYNLYFSVDKKYGDFFVDDRCDPFVVGLLTIAMRNRADIICEVPVSRKLLYQLKHYVIPILAANTKSYNKIELQAEHIDKIFISENAVATGWTGGVDSMFTLMKTVNEISPYHKLTHLMIANNGAIEGKEKSSVLKKLIDTAKKTVAYEFGLKVIGIETNIQDVFDEQFLAVETYRHAATILALQKLFSVYYNSSTYEFLSLSIDENNCAYYELLLCQNLSTENTCFYSAGGAYSRIEKLKQLSDFSYAQKYLHPCIRINEPNCNICQKCIRTMAALYALGTLNKFSSVFDVELFEQKKDWYTANVIAHKSNQHFNEIFTLMKQKGIKFSVKAQQTATMISAAEKVVKNNKQLLMEKLKIG